jgi:signal transduction histidine kinase
LSRLAVLTVPAEQHPVLATVLGTALVAGFVPILIHAHAMNGDFSQSVALIFLVPVLLASTVGGWLPGVIVSVIAEGSWNWFFTRPFGTIGFVSLEDFLAQAVFLVVALLVGQLSTLLRRRAAEALRRNAELAAVLDVTQSVGSTLDLVPLLGLILDHVRTVIDYNSAAIALRQGDKVRIVDYRGQRPFTEVATQSWEVSSATLYQEVANRGEPIIVDDVWAGEKAATAIRNSRMSVDSGVMDARAWLVVPLRLKGTTIGFISFSHQETGFYSREHATLALTFANQAAVAIENARLYEEAQEAAALQERNRLARELHDSVTQALYGITLYAEAGSRVLEAGDGSMASRHLRDVRDTAEDALRDMRLFIFQLRPPPSLEQAGLAAALTARLTAVEQRIPGMRTIIDVEPETELSPEAADVYYRIAQESLNNVLKHARATTVQLTLKHEDGVLRMTIVDNGCGFDLESAWKSGGMGLRGMTERCAELGARYAVVSAPGNGTSITVEMQS